MREWRWDRGARVWRPTRVGAVLAWYRRGFVWDRRAKLALFGGIAMSFILTIIRGVW